MTDLPVVDLRDLHERARRLQRVLTAPRTLEITDGRAAIAGTLARSHAVFGSVLALVDADEPAGLGVLVRALYEEWLVAVLIVEGNDDDRKRLYLDYLWWSDEHAGVWGHAAPWRPPGSTPKKWGLWKRVDRVDELVPGGTARQWYDDVYRLESFTGAHAGFATLGRHIRDGADDADGELVYQPQDDDEITARLGIATLLMLNIALQAWDAGGVDTAVLHEIGDFGTL